MFRGSSITVMEKGATMDTPGRPFTMLLQLIHMFIIHTISRIILLISSTTILITKPISVPYRIVHGMDITEMRIGVHTGMMGMKERQPCTA